MCLLCEDTGWDWVWVWVWRAILISLGKALTPVSAGGVGMPRPRCNPAQTSRRGYRKALTRMPSSPRLDAITNLELQFGSIFVIIWNSFLFFIT